VGSDSTAARAQVTISKMPAKNRYNRPNKVEKHPVIIVLIRSGARDAASISMTSLLRRSWRQTTSSQSFRDVTCEDLQHFHLIHEFPSR